MSPMLRRGLFGALFAVVLAAGIGIGALVFGDDDNDDTARTVDDSEDDGADDAQPPSSTTVADDPDESARMPSPLIPEEGLEGDALGFAAALNSARDLRYYARYEGVGEAADGTPSEMVVEVWRAPPQSRRDFTIQGEGEYLVSREYLVGDRVTGCFGLDADDPDDLACMDATASGTDPAAPAFEPVDPRSGEVTASEETVDGQVVRCFQLAAVEGSWEVCFDDAGIPVVVDDGEVRFVRTALSDQMAEDDFAPPST